MPRKNRPHCKFGIDIPESDFLKLEFLAKTKKCKRNKIVREAIAMFLKEQNFSDLDDLTRLKIQRLELAGNDEKAELSIN